jgi:catechol 2,3-dioxygenase-like lactoylglutathione lyase family enzyme
MLSVGRYGTRDLERAKTFYDAIAGLLGAGRAFEQEGLVAYKGPGGGMFLIGKPFQGEATVGNGVQLSFAAPSRSAVDAAHAKALELGGKCEGPPGVRGPDPNDPNGFYAAYFRDLDGNKLMVFNAAGM